MKVTLQCTIIGFSNDLQKDAKDILFDEVVLSVKVFMFPVGSVFMELTVIPKLREEEEPSGFL